MAIAAAAFLCGKTIYSLSLCLSPSLIFSFAVIIIIIIDVEILRLLNNALHFHSPPHSLSLSVRCCLLLLSTAMCRIPSHLPPSESRVRPRHISLSLPFLVLLPSDQRAAAFPRRHRPRVAVGREGGKERSWRRGAEAASLLLPLVPLRSPSRLVDT